MKDSQPNNSRVQSVVEVDEGLGEPIEVSDRPVRICFDENDNAYQTDLPVCPGFILCETPEGHVYTTDYPTCEGQTVTGTTIYQPELHVSKPESERTELAYTGVSSVGLIGVALVLLVAGLALVRRQSIKEREAEGRRIVNEQLEQWVRDQG